LFQPRLGFRMSLRKVCLIAMIFVLSHCPDSYAGNLNVAAELEYGVSDFQRDPEPLISETGVNFSQDYRLIMEGPLLKEGFLNAMFGAGLGDRYREDDVDFENQLKFDYGRWLSVVAFRRHETDEEIFFSGTTEPNSPIYTLTNNYSTELRFNNFTSLEYNLESEKRQDTLLGTVTGEKTETQTIRFRTGSGPLSFNSEYRLNDFSDLLGTRSNVESKDLNMELFYRPRDYFTVMALFDSMNDKDIDNNMELDSRDSQIEFTIIPLAGWRIRDRLQLREDKDTQTNEDIANKSNEIIVNYEPSRNLGFEASYAREDENKTLDADDIDSTIDEAKLRITASPVRKLRTQWSYEVSDKQSSASNENIKNTELTTDISYEIKSSLRIGGAFSNSTQKNTETALTESETDTISATMQYLPNQKIALFMRLDKSETENPVTGSFTQTDTISSNLRIEPVSYLEMLLRTGWQETTGSTDLSASERLLSAVELNLRPADNISLFTEYEMIDSEGQGASDEDLFDIGLFYNIGKLDFSSRFQQREVTGEGASDKTTILTNVKYRFSKDAVFSLRYSFINYDDEVTLSNSYDSTVIESLLSLRF